MAGGIAVIPVHGTLVNRSDWVSAESGLTSYERLSGMLAAAEQDPNVLGVLLDVDSPGGEAAGCADLADQIYAMREKKPVYAVANDMAASAAYKIASAAERVYATRTALVGSIGCIMAHRDQSAMNEKLGLKYTLIYAGARKADFSPHQPLSERAQGSAQQMIDAHYDLFTATVARNRGISQQAVKDTEAAVFMGEAAVTAGLADAVGTLGSAFRELADRITGRSTTTSTPTKETPTMSTTELNDPVNTEEPAAAASPQASADHIAEAVAKERARSASILRAAAGFGLTIQQADALVKAGCTLEQAIEQMTDMAASKSSAGSVSAVTTPVSGLSADELPAEERAAADWDRNPALRREFLSKEDYLAYTKASSKGLVRIFKQKQ